ncbi:hypothetical protein [Kitasatospora sp. NPDC127116]|uniref:hypothetical protein n=1 Tax=Kitasatospora sp. NPDC127116 TaxID=3345367 RepID=UPI003640EC01
MQVQVSRMMMAAVGAATGVTATGVGVTTDRLGLAVSGSALLVVSAMAICVIVVLRALGDTAAERAALIEERDLAIAAQVGVASERERVRDDLARGRKAAQDLLARERAAMFKALEEKRFAIQREGVETGILLALSGALDEMPAPSGVLLQLPVRQSFDGAVLAASDD